MEDEAGTATGGAHCREVDFPFETTDTGYVVAASRDAATTTNTL